MWIFDIEGIQYNIISNPIEAIEYLYQNISNCSLVIADYKMPQMSWTDFIKKDKGERYWLQNKNPNN